MKGRNNKSGKPRPSDKRRQYLKATEANKVPPISNLTPIERYYDVSSKLLVLFEKNLAEHKLDQAYIYGVRFAKFSYEALPKHDYYNAQKFELKNLRKSNKRDLMKVIDSLEEVVQLMDSEELEKAEIKRREEAALRKIREREELMKKEEEGRKAQKELMDRLNALDTMFPKPPTGVGEEQKNVELPTYDQAKAMREKLYEMPIGSDLPEPIPFSAATASAPEMAPPQENTEGQASAPPPPSYDDLIKQSSRFANYEKDSIYNLRPANSGSSRDLMNDPMPQYQNNNYLNNGPEPATFINPLGPLLPASLDVHGESKQSSFKIDVPIATLKYTSKNEYDALRKIQKVQVFYLNTYQGRNNIPGKDSTNGCTVISPLVAVHHLENNSAASLPDAVIEKVIDSIAPSILAKVRRKLGLSGHALIIPSDVHDYLVDEKILKQEMFVGVCGGNLLDGDHMNEFLNLLQNGEDSDGSGGKKNEVKKDCSKKVAAALFFHEHVVSILKVVLPDGSSWYDIVDSLPRRSDNHYDKLGATRTRCKDRDSLQSVLQWYACSKFSPADEKYIDTNEWDDVMCNFDPRVFQAFVWKA